ncbi:MAG: hypothetical protein GWP10_13270 [Nitrospiraceae bacterium]|nr:hypothetical protein [Nitrospiraceae bacterium]
MRRSTSPDSVIDVLTFILLKYYFLAAASMSDSVGPNPALISRAAFWRRLDALVYARHGRELMGFKSPVFVATHCLPPLSRSVRPREDRI